MSARVRLRRVRALLWFVVTLAVLLILGTVLLLTGQRSLMREEMIGHLERENSLLAALITEDLLTRHYSTIQEYVSVFGKEHREIASIRVLAPNNYLLASYARSGTTASPVRNVRYLDYDEHRKVTLEVVQDFAPVQNNLTRIAWQLGGAALVFVAVMGSIVWRVMRRTAFDPLENALTELGSAKERLELRVAERTADWMLSNKELKQEIAERLAVEQQLEIKDRAIETSVNGIAFSDLAGTLTYINPAFLRMWGYERASEVLGRGAPEFWHSPGSAEAVMEALRGRGSWVGELVGRKKDGSLFDVQLSADIVVDAGGHPLCMMGSFIDITERKRAEGALRKQKDFTAAVLNIVGAIMVVLDREGRIIRFNGECERTTGYTAGEALGRRVWDFLLPPEQVEPVKAVFQDLTAGKFPSHYENVWMARDGSPRLVAWSNTCLVDDAGEVEYVIATGIDITQSRAAELSLRNSEERLRSVTEAIPDVIYRRRPDGTITYASSSVRTILGYAPEEAVGMNHREFVHPEDVGRFEEMHRSLRAGLPVLEYSLKMLKKSGESIEAEVNVVPLKHADGTVHEIQGIIRDVTASRRAEAALRASENRYRLVVENINEIIYQVAIRDEAEPFRAAVEFVSGQVAKIVGYEAGAFLRDPHLWLSLIHRDDLQAIADSARRLVADRTGGTRVYRVRHGITGEYIWLEDKVVPRFDEGGRIIGYFGVARDITKRKSAEDGLMDALLRAEEEKNKSAAIIAAIGDGVSIQDRDFRVIYQNDVHKALIGNHIGEWCFQAYRGNADVCGGCPVALSFKDGQVHTVEHRNVINGKAVYVEIKASPLRDASGEIVAGIEAVRNITDRKRTEEDLRTSYETQKVINGLLNIPIESAPLPEIMQRSLNILLLSSYYSIHSTGGILLMDEATKGLRLAAQKGFNEYIRGTCKEVALGTCLCGRAAQTQEILFASDIDERHDIRFEGMEPHGHYCVPILLSGRTVGVLTLFLEQGHVHDAREEEFLRAIANALAGIIHRKSMEEERERLIADLRTLLGAVHASRQEWQETFDSIMDPIVIMDGSRTVLKANRAFSSLCGKRPQEAVAHDYLELLYGADAPQDDPVSRCLREAHQVNDDMIEPRSKRVYHTSVFPFALSEKDLPGAIMVMKDMTDERDREMRLIMSERLAALGQMASGIAHEINNPLAAIAGCVDGMSRRISREQYDPELFKRYLQIIKDEITRSKNITTSMLSFVRKSSYEKKQVQLPEIIDRTLEIIGYQGRLRRVQVVKQVEPDLPGVYGSEGELRQVLLIIITNALDAMNDSGILTVAAASDEQSVFIDIGDTGSGIPPENLVRIFDPFFTTKAERGGTGLGLSIAQRIIVAQSGTISARPSDPAGTVFRITFPRTS